MKPLTNEMLIEEDRCLHPRGMMLRKHEDSLECARCGKIWLSGSALQAKEEEMVEKFKEMIGDDTIYKHNHDFQIEKDDLYRCQQCRVRVNDCNKIESCPYFRIRNQLRQELRSKLSNLSEK